MFEQQRYAAGTLEETNHNKGFKIPQTIYDDLFHKIREDDREDEEQPQTFPDFLAMKERNMPSKSKKYIYILPLIGGDQAPTKKKGKKKANEIDELQLDTVAQFLGVYFCTETSIQIPKSNKEMII